MIDGLSGQGWAVVEGYFPQDMMAGLLQDVMERKSASALKIAGTGRDGKNGAGTVRTDETLWLDGSNDWQKTYLDRMGFLQQTLNRALFLGLKDYEAHYALYQPGGFYQKHLDSLHGARNRIVSCVTYLTPEWTEADAGRLVLYDRDDTDREVARILPKAGTLAVFLSEEIPHEVRPPNRERASIAGWFRCDGAS